MKLTSALGGLTNPKQGLPSALCDAPNTALAKKRMASHFILLDAMNSGVKHLQWSW